MLIFMNIVYCIDKNYNLQCYTSIYSLINNSKTLENIFILHKDPETFDKNKIKNLTNQNILIVNFNENLFFKKSLNFRFKNSHLSIATYFRLFLASIIPKDVENIVYLDADVFFIKEFDIPYKEVFKEMKNKNFKIGGKTAGDKKGNAELFERLNLKNGKYFNAGVLFINLKEWRDRKIESKFTELMYSNDFEYHDQDVLNKYYDGNYFEIPDELNYFIKIYEEYQDVVDKYIDNEAIVLHYVGESKPWGIKNFREKNSSYYQEIYFELFGLKHLHNNLFLNYLLNKIY